MTKTIEFYLDFMSPYAYLAHHHLLQMQSEFGFALRYHPIDLTEVKIAVGNTGPSNRAIPAKIAYLSVDLQRWASRYGIPLTVPGSHDSKMANIGLLVANDRHKAPEYCHAVWARTWGAGGDFASLALLGDVAEELGWNSAEFCELIASVKLENSYQKETDAAVSAGVFGVPIMMLGDEMWWGNDRLIFLQQQLERSQY